MIKQFIWLAMWLTPLVLIACAEEKKKVDSAVASNTSALRCSYIYDSVCKCQLYTDADQPANFGQGADTLINLLLRGLNIYDHESNRNIPLSMIIDTFGKVRYSYIQNKSSNKYFSDEKRIVNNAIHLPIKWEPATCQGVKVIYRVTLKISF